MIERFNGTYSNPIILRCLYNPLLGKLEHSCLHNLNILLFDRLISTTYMIHVLPVNTSSLTYWN